MNLVEATLQGSGKDGAALKLSSGEAVKASADASSARQGEAVTLGIRPEHLTLSDKGISATVALIEWLGNVRFAYLDTQVADEPLIMQLAPDDDVAEGKAVKLKAPPRHCHLFDRAGQAFPRPSEKPGSLAA